MKEDVMDTVGGRQLIKHRVCLEVNAKSSMRVMLLRCDAESRPANLVPLEGATIELSGDEIELPECKQWEICRVVGDLCRRGVEADLNIPQRHACIEHLSYAYSLLDDFKRFEHDIHLSDGTRETILSGALWRVESAMRCMGIKPDAEEQEAPSARLIPGDVAEKVGSGRCCVSTR